MPKRSIAIAAAMLASAGLIATTAHAAPKFGASSYSLSSNAESSIRKNDSSIYDWVVERFLLTIDFDSTLGVKDNGATATKYKSSRAEECDENKEQSAASSAPETETTAKTSPTGPEPLYLAF